MKTPSKLNITVIHKEEEKSVSNWKETKDWVSNFQNNYKVKNKSINLTTRQIYFSYDFILDKNQSVLALVDYLKILSNLNPQCDISISNDTLSKIVWNKIVSNNNELSPINYLTFLNGFSSLFIYRQKKFRDKYFLPVSDHFYLSAPAYKNEKLKNGAVFVQFVEDFYNIDELESATKKAAEYFVNFLKEKELFGKLDINNWRTVNRNLLEEKGFILPEWK